MSEDKKPRIIEGICEFCGVDARTCSHFKSGTYVASAPVGGTPVTREEKKIDLYKKLSNRKRVADIIIPHHNRHDHLHNLLERLPNDLFNIIVVSGGSFAHNVNKGARLAETDRLIICNDDCLPDPDQLVAACQREEDIIGFAQTIPALGNDPLYGVLFYTKDGHWKARMAAAGNEIHIPFGFLFAIKRGVWEDLGGFDEGFYNGGEDSDLFFRAIERGAVFGYQREQPVTHHHSQSDGRLTFSTDNQKYLDEKWPNQRVIEMFGLEGTTISASAKPLKILVATNHLDIPAGSETWTYTVVTELQRLGHEVEVFTLSPGELAKRLPVVEKPAGRYDLLLINHNSCLRALQGVSGYKVFTSHGVYPTLEQPEAGADAYVAVTPEIAMHMSKLGFDAHVIYNGVDTERFSPTAPTNDTLKKVLCMAKGHAAAGLVKEACEELGLTFRWIQGFWNTEEIINENDLVVTLGRGAMEAMACGRNVLVLDSRAYMDEGILADGMITADNAEEFARKNYSGRTQKRHATKEWLINELQKYDADRGAWLSQYAAKRHNVRLSVARYLEIYENHRDNARP